jgi:putative nucleotidyltransferase with HDIG domain
MQATVAAIEPQSASQTHRILGEREREESPLGGEPPLAIAGERREHEGHGRRLLSAFAALEAFPALEESRDRLLSVLAKDHVVTADIVSAIEADVAFTITVLRLAGAAQPSRRVDTVASAVELLGVEGVRELTERMSTFDFFERAGSWGSVPERFRLHALATQRAADRIACELRYEHRDRLAVTSILHDIGKLVMALAYPSYPSEVHLGARTPEERIHNERRELGVDHALVGGVLIRRWGLPESLASAIEQHHNPEAEAEGEGEGEAAFIRLADMLAHYEQGARVSRSALLQSAYAVGLEPAQLRAMMYESQNPSSRRQHHLDPCPLSEREHAVLRQLAAGGVYKKIAGELGLNPSTVRTHLHNIYRKLGAVDRAQAVLIATKRGWL